MMTDSNFWRLLRADFESLQPHKFGLMWTSVPQLNAQREPLESSWSWYCFPDASYAARLSAFALRGANALGYESEDVWYDELRQSDFLHFTITGSGLHTRIDGEREEYVSGCIEDVVKESITLCHRLEAKLAQRTALPMTHRLPSLAGGETSQGTAVGAMSRSTFWKSIQVGFEKYAKQCASLSADWHVKEGTWLLRWSSKPDCFDIPQQSRDVFNAIARRAATALPASHTTGGTEPWQLWLNFMRDRQWGFASTSTEACTEWEWDAGVKGGKTLAQVRSEQRYSTGDEWKKIYRRTRSGGLRRLSARELKGKSSNDLQKYFHWLENGTIEQVFETSARFCEDLASRAFEVEAASGRSQSGGSAVVGAELEETGLDGGINEVASNISASGGTSLVEGAREAASAAAAIQIERKEIESNLDSGRRASGRFPTPRTPDIATSRERLALVDTLARELAIMKLDLKGYCTVDGLKLKHPDFTLWKHIEDCQIKDLVDGEEFTPRANAGHLVLAKHGLTSLQTLKKDRWKIRKADKQTRRS